MTMKFNAKDAILNSFTRSQYFTMEDLMIVNDECLAATKSFLEHLKGWRALKVSFEKESQDYGAAELDFRMHSAKFRAAKVTPKKVGLFVTLWKRDAQKITIPHAFEDPFEHYLIYCYVRGKSGLFIFTKEILKAKKILSHNKKGGKRGFRVYPPWEVPTSEQALKTQSWQKEFFYEIT